MEGSMRKGIPFDDFLASLPKDDQKDIRVRSQELIQHELTLRDLRKAMGQTQAALAAKLGVKQENVSRVEQRADMMLSTLNGYLAAMGGELNLVVKFEGRSPVVLCGFRSAIEDGEKLPARTRRKSAT